MFPHEITTYFRTSLAPNEIVGLLNKIDIKNSGPVHGGSLKKYTVETSDKDFVFTRTRSLSTLLSPVITGNIHQDTGGTSVRLVMKMNPFFIAVSSMILLVPLTMLLLSGIPANRFGRLPIIDLLNAHTFQLAKCGLIIIPVLADLVLRSRYRNLCQNISDQLGTLIQGNEFTLQEQ